MAIPQKTMCGPCFSSAKNSDILRQKKIHEVIWVPGSWSPIFLRQIFPFFSNFPKCSLECRVKPLQNSPAPYSKVTNWPCTSLFHPFPSSSRVLACYQPSLCHPIIVFFLDKLSCCFFPALHSSMLISQLDVQWSYPPFIWLHAFIGSVLACKNH